MRIVFYVVKYSIVVSSGKFDPSIRVFCFENATLTNGQKKLEKIENYRFCFFFVNSGFERQKEKFDEFDSLFIVRDQLFEE